MYLQSYYHVGALIYLPLQVLKGHSPLVKYVPLYEIDKQKVSGAPSGALIQSVSLGQNAMAGRGILAKMPAPRAPHAA